MNMRNLLLVLALGAPACMVHGRGSMAVESTTPVVYQEPPAPQVEVEYSQHRPGYVWVRGRWNWTNGQWAWQAGHWERERAAAELAAYRALAARHHAAAASVIGSLGFF